MGGDQVETVRRWAPTLWAIALAVLMLGPALGPGYVLSYDMVWVPDLALRPDFLGTGTALPRAVPSDAVVAVVDEVLPGWWLQKSVLVLALAGGGAGIDRWSGSLGLPARIAAVTVYVWNPFVVERLVIGHWPVLLGYALIPWLAWLARSAGGRRQLPTALLVLAPLGSLSASAGLMSALVIVAFGWGRLRLPAMGVVLAAANAPWVVAGLLHAGAATSDPDAAGRFALQGEGFLPAPLTAAGLGGIWNVEVVPETREGLLGTAALVVLLGTAVIGWRRWRAETPREDWRAFSVLWIVGWVLAVLTWLAPDALGWFAAHVPGGGLVRDGSRLLGLCAPLLAVLVGHGVDQVSDKIAGWTREPAQGVFIATMLAVSPMALMPDAAWGSSGALGAVDYPSSYADVREVVPSDGLVLLLPFTSYRAPAWNDNGKVLDPLGRYLDADFVASDELVVSGVTIAGEDPIGDDVRDALAHDDPQARSTALAALGITTVVTELDAPGTSPEVAGTRLGETADHEVVALADVKDRTGEKPWDWLLWAAWAAYVGLFVGAAVIAARRRTKRRF